MLTKAVKNQKLILFLIVVWSCICQFLWGWWVLSPVTLFIRILCWIAHMYSVPMLVFVCVCVCATKPFHFNRLVDLDSSGAKTRPGWIKLDLTWRRANYGLLAISVTFGMFGRAGTRGGGWQSLVSLINWPSPRCILPASQRPSDELYYYWFLSIAIPPGDYTHCEDYFICMLLRVSGNRRTKFH